MFFPTYWTVTHVINEESPLFGISNERMKEEDGEILILFSGVDESISQTLHSRTSYKHDEIEFGARFQDMYVKTDNGRVAIDMSKLNGTVPIALEPFTLENSSSH